MRGDANNKMPSLTWLAKCLANVTRPPFALNPSPPPLRSHETAGPHLAVNGSSCQSGRLPMGVAWPSPNNPHR